MISVSRPLRHGRSSQGTRLLVRLGVYILRQWGAGLVGQTIGGLPVEQSKPSFDMDVGRVEFGRPIVRVNRVAGLIIARLILQSRQQGKHGDDCSTGYH